MRLLHTMLRVGNLQRSVDFYTKVLGMRLLRTSENAEYKYTLAFVGYSDESEGAVIELTYNWGVDKYNPGDAYGHIAWVWTMWQQPVIASVKMAAMLPVKPAR